MFRYINILKTTQIRLCMYLFLCVRKWPW